VWGPVLGVKILTLISSLAPAIGIYVMLRPLGVPAVLFAGLLAAAATTGEAAAWGGYPQLIGIGLLGLVLWALEQFVTTRSRRWAWAASIFLFVTLCTSDLVGPTAAAVAAVFLAVRVLALRQSDRPSARLLGLAVLIGLIPALSLAPVYTGLATSVLFHEATKQSTQHLTLTNLVPNLNNLFKDNVDFWYSVLVLGLLSPLLILVERTRYLAVAACAVLVPTAGATVILRDVRFLYLLPVVIAIGLAAWWTLVVGTRKPLIWWTLLADSRRPLVIGIDHLLIGTMAIVLLAQSALGLGTFVQQVNFYSVLTPGIVVGLQQLNDIAPRDATLAVSPGPGVAGSQGWPFGWWVEGLLDRPTYYASNLEFLNLADERRRAMLANEMFTSSFGMAGAIDLARPNGISYLVIATEWPGYESWVSTSSSLDGATVVIHTRSMLVISTSG
jgi:hypothetical protein